MSKEQAESFAWKVMNESTPGKPAPEHKLRLGVLISGSGTNLQAIIDAIADGTLPGVEIALVISNSAQAAGIQRALNHRLPVIYLPWRKFPRDAFLREMTPNEAQIAGLLQFFRVDLVVLAGWMRILSAPFLERFNRRVINIHPALLPREGAGEIYILSNGEQIPVFRGMHAAQMALDAGISITGSSVHYVTPVVDAGPVICQQEVAIEPGDTEDSLQERLKLVEHKLIVEAIKQLL
ncbi:MAG TPA: phosphoribosylglycinamide formyltransferase [Ktedonobacteraceae bacterium]|nr:phosphoribosylglycinamide formyltransferase [Ktedonobacteraceae bacterium]